ncbi:hypothetical protein BJX64DRAFT_19556 [Aspergillus heterothallicus]
MASSPTPLLPDLARRLQNMIDSLNSNPTIDVQIAEIGPPATASQIRDARRAAHGQLPPGLEEFYSQVGHFRLEWTYTGSELLPRDFSELGESDRQYFESCTPRGTVDIIPITRVFGSWAQVLYFPKDGDGAGEDEYGPDDPPYEEDDKSEEEEEEEEEEEDDDDDDDDDDDWRYLYAHLKPIDTFIPEAYTVLVGPRKQKKPKRRDQKFSDFIAYHYCGEELIETRYTFADYVERLLVSRGYWYWVTSLCHFDRDTREAEELKKIAPQIFPDMDLSLFVP